MATPEDRFLTHSSGEIPLLEHLLAHRLFSVLPKVVLVGLTEKFEERQYRKGHYIYRVGDTPDFLFMVRAGLVLLTRSDVEGRPHALIAYYPNDIVGLSALVLGHRRTAVACALVDTTALLLDRDTFLYLYRNIPELADRVTQELYRSLSRSRDLAMRFTQTPTSCRVASFLLEYSANTVSRNGDRLRFDLDLSHQDIALLLGTSRETVTRVFANLSRRGLIGTDDRQMVILKPDELQRLAQT